MGILLDNFINNFIEDKIMSLKSEMNKLIKDEINNDPKGIGYSGKTDQEIADLLNSGVSRSLTNYYTEQTPISRILSGLGFAPNICDSNDVKEAKES